MPMSAGRPSTMNSFLPAEIPHNSMAGKQILPISEPQFDKFPTQSSFLYWKIRIQNPGNFSFRFSLGSHVMDQRSGDGRFSGRLKNIAFNSGFFSFPESWDAGCEDCVLL